jgi:hypothetical protein
METTEAPATTAQSGRIIEKLDSSPREFYSEKIGRDYGASFGWTNDRAEATLFPDEAAAQKQLDGMLLSVAPFCQVVKP